MRVPLGHDAQGEPIDVPDRATAWRVRRHSGGRGRPGLVYGRDGSPLVVPIAATAEDLRTEGVSAGTYRLEALDAEGRPLAGTVAITQIDGGEEAEAVGPDALAVALRTLDGYREICSEQAKQLGQAFEVITQTQAAMVKSLVAADVIKAQPPPEPPSDPAPSPPAAKIVEDEGEVDGQDAAMDKMLQLANAGASLVNAVGPLVAPLIERMAEKWFPKAASPEGTGTTPES